MRTNGFRRALRGVAAVLAVAALGGCATGTSADEEVETLDGRSGEESSEDGEGGDGEVSLDPMLVRGSDAEGPGETVDSNEVFEKAYEAYSDRRYEDAVEHYETIVQYFDESRFYRPSLYNGGLSYEKLERWEAAARMYRTIIEEFPDDSSTNDAYYRLAEVYKNQGRHGRIAELMTEVMLREGVETFDRIEAHTRRSEALLEVGNLEEAEQGFRTVLELNREAEPDQRLPKDSRYICKAYLGLGEVFKRRQSAIVLELPTEKMGDDLERKADLLLEAQTHYLRALRQRHPKWSVAAGYQIGRLYEDFYSDIFAAEIPDDLSDEQVAMYFDTLRERLRPVMERAIEVYEKNLSLSERMGETPEENRWVAETAESLRRMREFLNDPATRERAEELVREGRDFRALWRPWKTARERVESAVDEAADRASARRAESGDPES